MQHYLDAVFVIDQLKVVLSPYSFNETFDGYLKSNGYANYAIITAFVSAQINNVGLNNELNELLERDINNHKYIKCYGADKVDNPKHVEQSFFIFDIKKKDAIALCKKYKQDCIVYGEVDFVPTLIDGKGKMIN